MRSVLVLGSVLMAVWATHAPAQAASCDAWLLEAECVAIAGDLVLVVHREGATSYRVHAEACLQAPGNMVIAWWVSLTDDPPGALVVPSIPTDDADCPHRALAQPLARFGTFGPAYTCGQIAGTTAESAGSRLVCNE